MKVRYLDRQEHGRSRALYEEVFVEDEQAFVDAYYQIKAADNEILVAEEDGEIVSMLHRNPYTFWLRGVQVPADYLVAVATRVAFRHRGLMRALLTRALRDMKEQGYPFTFLMPADEAIYTPFDFRLMGNDDEEGLAQLGPEELEEDYDLYPVKDAAYERRHISWPEWETTPMMIRLVHLPAFVKGIGAEREQNLLVKIKDSILAENDGVFLWSFSEEGSTLVPSGAEPEICISIADLGSFLCGMLGAEELPGLAQAKDPDAVREKLERIRVLDGIYINETV